MDANVVLPRLAARETEGRAVDLRGILRLAHERSARRASRFIHARDSVPPDHRDGPPLFSWRGPAHDGWPTPATQGLRCRGGKSFPLATPRFGGPPAAG